VIGEVDALLPPAEVALASRDGPTRRHTFIRCRLNCGRAISRVQIRPSEYQKTKGSQRCERSKSRPSTPRLRDSVDD